MIKLIFAYTGHVTRTLMCFYQDKYSSEWDVELNELLDCAESGVRFSIGDCTLTVGGIEVWVENKFYSYGHLHIINGDELPEKLRRRPKFKTMLRLDGFIMKEKVKEENDKTDAFLKKHGRK